MTAIRSAESTESGNVLAGAVLVVATSAYVLRRFQILQVAFLAVSFAAPLLLLFLRRSVRLSRRIPVALVAMVGWTVATVLWTADPEATRRLLIDVVAFAALGFSTGAILGVDGMRRALSTVWKVLLSLCAVTLAVAPEWAARPDVDRAPGWHGVLGHKNALGSVAALALVTFWFDARTPARRRWLALALVLLVGSRSSTALAIVLILVCLLVGQATLRVARPRLRWCLLTATGIAFVTGIVATFTNRLDVFASILGRDPTLSGRTQIWDAVWRAIELRPLEGQGLAGVWSNPTEPTATIWKELHFESAHAHSGYLDLLLQLGVVGALLFVVLVGSTVAQLARRHDRVGQWGIVTIAVLCINAFSETGPILNDGFLILSVLATAAAQRPSVTLPWQARYQTRSSGRSAASVTPARRRLSTSSA